MVVGFAQPSYGLRLAKLTSWGKIMLRCLSRVSAGVGSVLFLFLLLNFSFGCAPQSSINTSFLDGNADNQTGAVTTPPTQPNLTMKPLAWEPSARSSNLWSAYIYSVISIEEPQMLSDNSALDANLFCPRYAQLSKTERLNFWGQLFAAVAKYESGWSPTSRYVETTMGTDPITGRQVASEGLLQLSYQDSVNYGQAACDFDWNKDRIYSDTDARKTILDPYKNLRCGIKIMAKLLKKKQMISFETGVYWSTLRKGRPRVNDIIKITKSLSFCTTAQ